MTPVAAEVQRCCEQPGVPTSGMDMEFGNYLGCNSTTTPQRSSINLNCGTLQTRLPDDGGQRPLSQFIMVWNGNGNHRAGCLLLHYDMTASTANFHKTVL